MLRQMAQAIFLETIFDFFLAACPAIRSNLYFWLWAKKQRISASIRAVRSANRSDNYLNDDFVSSRKKMDQSNLLGSILI
jgi:hypothetical protein